MGRALLAVFVLAQAAGAAAQGSTHDLAQGLQNKIKEHEARFKAGKPPREKRLLVTDAELTAYLNLAARLPPSVSNLDVQFDRDRIAVKGQLDLDQLQGKLPSGGALGGFALFSGRVSLLLKGRLQSDDGFGTFQLEDARVGSIPLAPAMVAQLVAAATRSADAPQGVDIVAPFRFPYGVRSVRISPGRAVLEF